MGFKPGVSGNPAGRPKKLLRRVDEVLHERGIEPIAVVLDHIAKLGKTRGKGAAAAKKEALQLWMELLPYCYARPKELTGQLDLKVLEPFVIHRPGGDKVEIGAKETEAPGDKAL